MLKFQVQYELCDILFKAYTLIECFHLFRQILAGQSATTTVHPPQQHHCVGNKHNHIHHQLDNKLQQPQHHHQRRQHPQISSLFDATATAAASTIASTAPASAAPTTAITGHPPSSPSQSQPASQFASDHSAAIAFATTAAKWQRCTTSVAAAAAVQRRLCIGSRPDVRHQSVRRFDGLFADGTGRVFGTVGGGRVQERRSVFSVAR